MRILPAGSLKSEAPNHEMSCYCYLVHEVLVAQRNPGESRIVLEVHHEV